MATAAAGRGGQSPPRNGSSESANGNMPAGLLSLAESISDLDLTNVPIQVNRFLSAKNSVELHRSRGRRFFPNQSLPSVLDAEDAGQATSTLTQELNEVEEEPEREGSRSDSGRSVNWADLRSTPAREALTEEYRSGRAVTAPSAQLMEESQRNDAKETKSEETFSSCHRLVDLDEFESSQQIQQDDSNVAVKAKAVGSHMSLCLANPEPETISLHGPTISRPFLSGQSSMVVDIESCKRKGQKRLRDSESNRDIVSPSRTGMFYQGGTPESSSSQEVITGNEEQTVPGTLINKDDGLVSTENKKSSADERLERNATNVFTPNANDSKLLPTQPDYCGLPIDQLKQPNDPLVYYHEEEPIPPVLNAPIGNHLQQQDDRPLNIPDPPTDNINPTHVDYDDEIDLDAKPEIKLFSADDVPVPDHSFVARTVSATLHPLILRDCKKDCRTWLWKSQKQREVALRLQRENDMNGFPPQQ